MLNSTKTWQDNFDENRDEFNHTFRGLLNTVAKKHSNTYFGEYSDDFEYRRLVHFISDLRKRDMEELIKMLEEFETYAYIPEFKKAIQDYYENN